MSAWDGSWGDFPSGVTLIVPRTFKARWSIRVTVASFKLPTTAIGLAWAGWARATASKSPIVDVTTARCNRCADRRPMLSTTIPAPAPLRVGSERSLAHEPSGGSTLASVHDVHFPNETDEYR